MAETVTEAARPLTADEKKILADLMSRENAWTGPAVRIGEPYVALVNLSVPRRGDKDRQSDLVLRGETVHLTEEEARAFNRHGSRDGRMRDVVRKVSGPDGSHAELPRMLPRDVSGRLFRPAAPPPGSDAPRPDPEGSSRVQVLDDGGAPESAGAMSAEPSEMADVLRESTPQDAVDVAPRRTRTRVGQ
jgi:hypothetical protein